MPLTSVIHLIRRLSEYGWEQRFLLEKTRMEKNKLFSCWIQKELVTVKGRLPLRKIGIRSEQNLTRAWAFGINFLFHESVIRNPIKT